VRTGLVRRVISLCAALALALMTAPVVAAADTNVAPTVSATVSDATPDEGQTVIASATFTDPESATETYTCSILYGDGPTIVPGVVSGMTCTGPEHLYTVTGNYPILVTVTDSGGASGAWLVGVNFINAPPNVGPPALLNGAPEVGATVNAGAPFIDLGSEYFNRPLETYTCWFDYGDGSGVQQGTYIGLLFGVPTCSGPNHVYQAAGTYTLKATVTDSGGASGTAQTALVITTQIRPIVTPPTDQYITSAMAASYGGNYLFPLGSFTDPAGASAGPWSWTIYWGDGTQEGGTATTQGALLRQHHYVPGTYRARLSVMNAKHWQGDGFFNVTVADDLVATFSAPSANPTEGLPMAISFYWYDPEFATQYPIHIDWGDGSSQDVVGSCGGDQSGGHVALSHVYAAADPLTPNQPVTVYTAVATVTGGRGRTASASLPVGVIDVAPVVTATPVNLAPSFSGQITLATFTDASVGPWFVRIESGGVRTEEYVQSPGPITIDYSASYGSRTFNVLVGDRAGLYSTVTVPVTVNHSVPVVSFVHMTPHPNIEANPGALLATISDPEMGAGATYTCTVDYGDGSGILPGTVSGDLCEGPAHVYRGLGPYTASAWVTDSFGGIGTATGIVTLLNDPPEVAPIVAGPVDLGATTNISAQFTDRGLDVTDETYVCTVDYGDGTGPQDGSISDDWCLGSDHAYAQAGTYTVSVRVTDSSGGSGTGTSSVSVRHVAPIVSLGLPGYSGIEPSAVVASATFTDPESATESYTCTINYGDGTVVAGVVSGLTCSGPEHHFQATGPYTVTATVTDSNGLSGSSASDNYYVNEAPWVGGLSLVGDVRVGSAPHAVAAVVDPGQDFETYTCTIDYGDGSSIQAGTWVPTGWSDDLPRCVFPDHVYGAVGTYLLTATVTDGGGATGSAQYYDNIIAAVPLIQSISAPSPIDEGTVAAPSAVFWPTGLNETYTCSFDFIDGRGPQPGVVTGSTCQGQDHAFTRPGDVMILATVTSSGGQSSTYAIQVTVNNVAPAITSISVPSAGIVGVAYRVTLSFDDPGLPSAEWYLCKVDFGDGTAIGTDTNYANTCQVPPHLYSAPGDYHVVASIEDEGGSGSYAQTVSIYEPIKMGTVSAPASVSEGSTVVAWATFTPSGAPETYTCAIDYDDGAGAQAAQISGSQCFAPASLAYFPVGNHTITVYISGSMSGNVSATRSISVVNVAPVLKSSWTKGTYELGTAIGPDATFIDPGWAAGYPPESFDCSIDYGDGTGKLAGNIITNACQGPFHAYLKTGTFKAVMTVTDSNGGAGTYTWTVTVVQTAPFVLPVTAPNTTVAGTSITASAAFISLPGGGNHTCTVDYGDGKGALAGTVSGSTCSGPKHAYAGPGSFTITVKVRTSSGKTGQASKPIVVAAPSLTVGSISLTGSLVEGSNVTATAPFTSAASQSYTCKVDYGDGSGALTGTVSGTTCTGPKHAFSHGGPMTVTVAVTGSLGSSAAAMKSVTVANVMPSVTSITLPSLARIGTSVTVTAAFTDPGTAETYSVVVDWQDGTRVPMTLAANVRTISASHTYRTAAYYPVTVEVSDDGMAHAATGTANIVVYDPARSVSGSGTFASPAGACLLTSKCSAPSTANFTISAWYSNGATKPSGTFTFSVPGLSYAATSFDSYIVTDGMGGVLCGTGKVNGASGYRFCAFTIDGSPDKIVVEITGLGVDPIYYDTDYIPLKTGSIVMK
jgi:PKD repeat protein